MVIYAPAINVKTPWQVRVLIRNFVRYCQFNGNNIIIIHHKVQIKYRELRRKISVRVQTCRMSLCLWRVCMRAAFREAVPGVLVYSAILSFTAVSFTEIKNSQLIKNIKQMNACKCFVIRTACSYQSVAIVNIPSYLIFDVSY